MNIGKIAGLLGLAVAVVGAFVNIPYAALALLVLGLVVGFGIVKEDHVRVIVSALALLALAHNFDAVPAAGQYLTSIFDGVAKLAGGGALMIISRNIVARFTS
ncbi:MAG TPA: hypothetical protein VKO83_04960 [Steroidobacteraceae bacterium]|nr:hypothetical protein [Steroidobacteraceae bacterium]